MHHLKLIISCLVLTSPSCISAWMSTPPFTKIHTRYATSMELNSVAQDKTSAGNLHGDNACFLPLEQLDQEYFAPRIIQIAGSYPGLNKDEYLAVTSTPPAEQGQWNYDFSDASGPQMGTVAVRGCEIISFCEDPVAVICEHFSLGVPLPDSLTAAVDLLAVVDRAKKGFAERKFLVLDIPGEGIVIRAFAAKTDLPANAEILGRVVFVQIPWLPCMKKTKSGFMEEDELF